MESPSKKKEDFFLLDYKHFLITSKNHRPKQRILSKHDRMHMRTNGEGKGGKEEWRKEKEEKKRKEKKRKEKKGPRAGQRRRYGFAGRIAPCLYNNVIAANEENWYKIAGSSGPIRGGPVSEREQHNARGSDRAGRSPMAAAATSAAISMEMRWMSAISYDKISAQKRRAQAETWGPPVVFCNHANRAPENLRSLPPLLCLSFLLSSSLFSTNRPSSYPPSFETVINR